eukprot:2848448-Rhodomonas_salina.1
MILYAHTLPPESSQRLPLGTAPTLSPYCINLPFRSYHPTVPALSPYSSCAMTLPYGVVTAATLYGIAYGAMEYTVLSEPYSTERAYGATAYSTERAYGTTAYTVLSERM